MRRAIADIGGMMPEEMPTPKKSLKELEREKKQLENKEMKKLISIVITVCMIISMPYAKAIEIK